MSVDLIIKQCSIAIIIIDEVYLLPQQINAGIVHTGELTCVRADDPSACSIGIYEYQQIAVCIQNMKAIKKLKLDPILAKKEIYRNNYFNRYKFIQNA